jgi:hypothetical protein
MPWFKGNLHCHSSRSDGRATPADVGLYYRLQGHNFLGLSDHNRLTPPGTCATPAGLLGIPCSEYTGEICCHVLAVGAGDATAPAPSRRRKPRPKTAILQDGVNRARAVGAIPVICHPAWNWTLGFDEIAAVRGCRHFEICNASPDCNAHPVPGFEPLDALWDRLLTAGKRYFGLANDDAHDYFRPYAPRAPLGGLGYNVVRAPALTVRHVVDAIRRGRFYATTGVELARYRVTASGVSLAVRRQQREQTVFQFFGADGRELRRIVGERARYRFRGDEGYVRVRISSTCGYRAWTQPVFLDDLSDPIRWSDHG